MFKLDNPKHHLIEMVVDYDLFCIRDMIELSDPKHSETGEEKHISICAPTSAAHDGGTEVVGVLLQKLVEMISGEAAKQEPDREFYVHVVRFRDRLHSVAVVAAYQPMALLTTNNPARKEVRP